MIRKPSPPGIVYIGVLAAALAAVLLVLADADPPPPSAFANQDMPQLDVQAPDMPNYECLIPDVDSYGCWMPAIHRWGCWKDGNENAACIVETLPAKADRPQEIGLADASAGKQRGGS